MKRRLFVSGVLLILTGCVLWFMVFRRAGMYKVRAGIPSDAIFVAETPSFNAIHDKLSSNAIWTFLKEYPYFASYHARLEWADSLCRAYPVLRKWLTDRPFAVSCHWVSASQTDFLYVCDLGKLNVIQGFEGMLAGLMEGCKTERKGEVTRVEYEQSKLYYAIYANLLFVSFSEQLVLSGLESCGQAKQEEEKIDAGDLNLKMDYSRLGQWLDMLFSQPFPEISTLDKTLLSVYMEDQALHMKGETWPDRKQFSVLNALNLVEGEASHIQEIAGNHVAAYFSLCFHSFDELKNILTENYKITNLKEYSDYERTLVRLNKWLGLDLETVFTSWIGNEISLIKPAMDKESRPDNLVIAIQAKDIDLAADQLAYLAEQIDRRTPIRFKELAYNQHIIRFLSLKGFFNLFLGSFFKKLDKPYYTILGNYVVFSNSAATLAAMIKDYSLGNTLEHEEKHNGLMEQLGTHNNIYGYISSPEAYEYLYHVAEPGKRKELTKNSGAFRSFESIGTALANVGSAYQTRIIARHNTQAEEDYQLKELNRQIEELVDRIESGYYGVLVPDSIAISTRGAYSYNREEMVYSGHLSNGDPDGIWHIKDRQGRTIGQCMYREGQPCGESRFFYPDGVVHAEVVYDKGKIKSYKEFFNDGTLKTEIEYNKGLRHGETRFYYSTGHLLGEGKYRKGRRTGTWKYFRVTGELKKKLKF